MINKKTLIFSLTLAISCAVSNVHAAQTLSHSTASVLQKASDLHGKNQLDLAIKTLKNTDPKKALDQAYIDRMLGVLYWEKNHPKQAISYLTKAVESNTLKDDQAWATRRMLADLLVSDEEFKPALRHYYRLTQSIPKNEKGSDIWLRIAQIHYQLGAWKSTLKAIRSYDSYRPKTSVLPLSLKIGAHLQLRQYRSAIPALKQVIQLEPQKKVWWQQLVSAHLQLKQYANALSTLKLAQYNKISLNQQELRQMAHLYANQGIPKRAAEVIAQLKNAGQKTELLVEQAQYWQMAKEWPKAIEIWRKAALLDSTYQWQLAQLLLQQGQAEAALLALNEVKAKSKKQQLDIDLAKVQAYHNLNQLEKALSQAQNILNTSASPAAKSWVRYLTQKLKFQ